MSAPTREPVKADCDRCGGGGQIYDLVTTSGEFAVGPCLACGGRWLSRRLRLWEPGLGWVSG